MPNDKVGQWVYVKLCPYRQVSITGIAHNKLTKRFFGPFEIFECIGKVAYRLQLSDNARIHPVFHSSFLHPHYGPIVPNVEPFPPHVIENKPVVEPMAILYQVG